MGNYNAESFNPAAPMALVSFINRASGQEFVNVPMLIDTGSDVTSVPAYVASELKLESTPTTLRVALVNGDHKELNTVQVQMKWNRYTVNGAFAVTHADFGILGRNVLNRVRILFDGPAQSWSLV